MIATYRLQLGPSLDLRGARTLVPYLRELGVSHLYLSPVWQAQSGSTHGYDVVDPRRVSEALGGEEALRELGRSGLELLLDIVPNHMAASAENPFWADESLRARFFDVDARTGRHRRFFDVDELAGVRMEDPRVFDACHEKVRQLIREGVAAGLRIDHPDGLSDPAGYLRRTRALGAPVWVEKILEPGEALPDWPVEGTTGYDFLNEAMGVFVATDAEPAVSAIHAELAGRTPAFAEVARAAKREQAATTFSPEVERLRRLLDLPGMAEDVAALPVYRTYVVPERRELSTADRAVVLEAGLSPALRDALLLRAAGHDELVRLYQQTTGAVMAKGVEDTAFYRYTRLLALNEVGGDPARFGLPIASFHSAAAARARLFPRSLLATTTHDTKRSADARARLVALTHQPELWAERVRAWRDEHTGLRRGTAPDGSEEYLLYQTLVAAWPIARKRLEEYLVKALREAKVNTAWVGGDPGWEANVLDFAASVVARPGFGAEVEALLTSVAASIECVTIGQVALKLMAPGVPDIYQGDEDGFLALVDPDNRRVVDWGRLRERLELVVGGGPLTPDLRKLALVREGLALRRRRPDAFAGGYTPLSSSRGLLAFARGEEVIVVVPTRPTGWNGRVDVPAVLAGRWRNVITSTAWRLDGAAPARELCGVFPVAVLERAP